MSVADELRAENGVGTNCAIDDRVETALEQTDAFSPVLPRTARRLPDNIWELAFGELLH
jgi:hypothetical protein